MAESKTVSVVPLNGSNYPTWKVQCQMALMKEGLWKIVNGEEAPPAADKADKYAKFVARRDRALATIVLSVQPSLLYLIGEPEDPTIVWKKLSEQFQKKTWANKLELRRRLYSLRLKEGDSVQEHIKAMIEIFNGLSVIGDPVSDEDRVVHLLASLPETFNMLVTALEASPNVPKMEIVTERLLHEERKMKDRGTSSVSSSEKAMAAKRPPWKRGPKCHHCGKFGHIKRNCRDLAPNNNQKEWSRKQKANNAEVKLGSSNNESESDALVAGCALAANATRDTWIVDSGATCHMCNNDKLFTELRDLRPLDVTLGDGHNLKASGKGTVLLQMSLHDGTMRKCSLNDVLYVPSLSYNLLSVSKAAEAGKTTRFNKTSCEILTSEGKIVSEGTKVGSLYYLDCHLDCLHAANTAENQTQETTEDTWHRRFGHLGLQSLKKLAKEKLVNGLNLNVSKEISFCESCTEGKHHRSQFPTSGAKRSEEVLGLVHTDVCGKMNVKSLTGGEYFLTFIDDKTRYVWVYILKRKDQVFEKFREWKALVENSTGQS